MSSLVDLISRVEKLEGPNYEAEVEIARALEPNRLAWRQAPPNYTYSLDAALALVERVLPDMLWEIGSASPPGHWARLYKDPLECGVAYGGPTPAVALILALLRALQNAGEHHD